FPVTNVCREAEVLPQSGVTDVSAETRSKQSIGALTASAQIWVIIVFEPCPISTAPWCKAMRPFCLRPIRTVDGFESDVLPHPYHIPAIPTPRRRLPDAFALKRSAEARAAVHFDRSASKQAPMPTPLPIT